MSATLQLSTPPAVLTRDERTKLERRARVLAWGGIGWHVVELQSRSEPESPLARSR